MNWNDFICSKKKIVLEFFFFPIKIFSKSTVFGELCVFENDIYIQILGMLFIISFKLIGIFDCILILSFGWYFTNLYLGYEPCTQFYFAKLNLDLKKIFINKILLTTF